MKECREQKAEKKQNLFRVPYGLSAGEVCSCRAGGSVHRIRNLTETALLAVLLFLAGLFRLPSPVPGSEFQLSAPLAVALCGVFGFRRYLLAGILASVLTLLTGGGTIFHVLIAMTYRLAAGAVYGILGPSRLFYLCAGPVGTLAARAVLSLAAGGGFWALAAAAVPGMILTAFASRPLAKVLERIRPGRGICRKPQEISNP